MIGNIEATLISRGPTSTNSPLRCHILSNEITPASLISSRLLAKLLFSKICSQAVFFSRAFESRIM